METTKEVRVTVCDACGISRLLVKCDFCGAMICKYCGAMVFYTQTETVRGHCIGFSYCKTMCQKHLPKEK